MGWLLCCAAVGPLWPGSRLRSWAREVGEWAAQAGNEKEGEEFIFSFSFLNFQSQFEMI
jgi:hypothetical protein